MTSRDRRALVIGGLVVLVSVIGLRVLPWAARRTRAAHTLLQEHAALLARTRAELASLPELRDSAAVLSRGLIAIAPQVLSGATQAEAGADLTGRLNLVASRAPARVSRLDPLPDSTYAGRLGRVRVHARLETDVRGVVALLRAIETGAEVLQLQELRIDAAQPGGAVRGPEILRVEVTVSGWYIKPREAGSGKRET